MHCRRPERIGDVNGGGGTSEYGGSGGVDAMKRECFWCGPMRGWFECTICEGTMLVFELFSTSFSPVEIPVAVDCEDSGNI